MYTFPSLSLPPSLHTSYQYMYPHPSSITCTCTYTCFTCFLYVTCNSINVSILLTCLHTLHVHVHSSTCQYNSMISFSYIYMHCMNNHVSDDITFIPNYSYKQTQQIISVPVVLYVQVHLYFIHYLIQQVIIAHCKSRTHTHTHE